MFPASPRTSSHAPKIFLRGGTYYIKRNVPRAIQPVLGCSQIWRSLKTSDAVRAQVLARVEYQHIETEFAAARLKLNAINDLGVLDALKAERRHGSKGTLDLLRAHHIPHLAERYRAIALACDDEERFAIGRAPASERRELLAERMELLEEARRQLRDAVISHDESVMLETAEALVRAERLVPRHNSPALRKLCAELLPLDLQIVEQQLARLEGRPSSSPAVPPAVRDKTTLADLIDFWAVHAAPRPQTVKDVRAIVRGFQAQFGELAVDQITKHHGLRYRDTLIGRGQARKTIEKKLTLLNAVVNSARKEAHITIEKSPFAEVTVWKTKVKSHAVKRRRPFSVPQLQQLFDSPIYKKSYRPKGAKGAAGFFMPLIALFSGCREEEIAQLRTEDVIELQGTWVLRICDYGQGQQVKTGAAIRHIPVHAALIEAGFLKYFETLRATGEARIFPLLQPGCRGRYSDAYSKWFNRYLDVKVGITENSYDFHSLRHTFRNQLRICGVEEEVADALMGHSSNGKSEGRQYGRESFPLEPLVLAMKRLRYEGLNLTGIRWGGANESV